MPASDGMPGGPRDLGRATGHTTARVGRVGRALPGATRRILAPGVERMHDLKVFAAALTGEDALARSLAGPDGVLCVAPALSSVFLVEPAAGGGQTGTVAVVGASGGGMVSLVELPRSFQVLRIGHDQDGYVLTREDGRSVRGTPAQFAAHPKLVDREHNPAYEEHLEEAFLATRLIPAHDGTAHAGTEDGGTGDGTEYGGTVHAAGLDIELSFDCAGPEKTAALLPHARRLVADFARIRRAATEFLHAWGAEGDGTDEERLGFAAAMVPTGLVVYRSGDFEVAFEDTSGTYFLDGYWPNIVFRADMTPVDLTVEC
ncbi:hypothetical protein ACFRR7_35625 [Streptomyces sp. NPDC056909]|uniref:hypothetical protein n=1 Tax=Streptomyces sp. NPDC056909 TaxID=3345963 RepID=UPI0036B5E78D